MLCLRTPAYSALLCKSKPSVVLVDCPIFGKLASRLQSCRALVFGVVPQKGRKRESLFGLSAFPCSSHAVCYGVATKWAVGVEVGAPLVWMADSGFALALPRMDISHTHNRSEQIKKAQHRQSLIRRLRVSISQHCPTPSAERHLVVKKIRLFESQEKLNIY